jgi:hypothetical protein
MLPKPPAFPRELLESILPAGVRDTVIGDLLEEYRETRLPALGPFRADLWYWREFCGIWLRAYGWFMLPVVLALIVPQALNTFRASSGASYLGGVPGFVFPVVIGPMFFAFAGARGSARTGEFSGGLVASLGTCFTVWVFSAIWCAVTFYPFAAVQASNPGWIHAWQWSIQHAHMNAVGSNPALSAAGFREWLFWDNVGSLVIEGCVLSMAAIVFGSAGSGLGLLKSRRRRTAPISL